MVVLKEDEIKWLGDNYPQLSYDAKRQEVFGIISFSLRYEGCSKIVDSYQIRIDFSKMTNRKSLPHVYNTDKRLFNAARRKKKPLGDFHVNPDDSLCLIAPFKIGMFYPSGFDIKKFMDHLCNHLYWVSYYERYDKEPWISEKHGGDAFMEFLMNPSNYPITDKDIILYIRQLYKKVFGKGIAVAKLRRLLQNDKFIKSIIQTKL